MTDSRFLEEKENHIVELESQVQEMGELQGDKAELLENIQSDKTALSRALTQNKDLKIQLAELQNGFVKLVGLVLRNKIGKLHWGLRALCMCVGGGVVLEIEKIQGGGGWRWQC